MDMNRRGFFGSLLGGIGLGLIPHWGRPEATVVRVPGLRPEEYVKKMTPIAERALDRFLDKLKLPWRCSIDCEHVALNRGDVIETSSGQRVCLDGLLWKGFIEECDPVSIPNEKHLFKCVDIIAGQLSEAVRKGKARTIYFRSRPLCPSGLGAYSVHAQNSRGVLQITSAYDARFKGVVHGVDILAGLDKGRIGWIEEPELLNDDREYWTKT
jgi:hypothetical protein